MRLKRWDPSSPALRRRRRGRGFSYTDVDGDRVTDAETLDRIRALVIPPAWRDVRICPWPHGHLQAVGVDDAGRRQYLYHQQWRARRDREKFVRVREFAQRLPAAREQIAHDLQSRGLHQRRVLATAARLLDVGFFRVGGEQYVQDNGSYGLATVLAGHVDIGRNGALTFSYPAKSGQQRAHSVVDRDVARVLRSLRSRRGPGETLLAYYQAGTWHNVTSDDINAYLRDVFGGDVSAKDFRTWHGTVLTAVALAATAQPRASRTAKQRAKVQAIKDVSDYLDNTPAVCRSSYVDPVVLDAFDRGETVHHALGDETLGAAGEFRPHSDVEQAVLDLLRS